MSSSEHPSATYRFGDVSRVLVTGWAGLELGEATVGDVLALDVVHAHLADKQIPHELAWSRVMCPPGGLVLDDADPTAYTHLVFVCGPVHGEPIERLCRRFAHARRIAVGVSVVDPHSPAVTAFDVVIPRDDGDAAPHRDLAATADVDTTPVIGVFLTSGQGEYGSQRRHEDVIALLEQWLGSVGTACLPLDTRLDPRDWRLATTPAQVQAVISRLDAVVTMRLHGLVLALRAGVPALAVDPVAGGAKLAAQAHAWDWPALVHADDLTPARLDAQLAWCLGEEGRTAAEARATLEPDDGRQLDRLVESLTMTT